MPKQTPIWPPTSPMTRTRLRSYLVFALSTAVLTSAFLWPTGSASAQERSSGNLFDNLFGRGEPAQSREAPRSAPTDRIAQADPGELAVRLDRMESALRQLTGTIEQLQYRNQQLEMQLKRMQDNTEYRFQQMGTRGGAAPAVPPGQAAPTAPGNAPPAASPGRRSDVFDPAQHPNAPGAPRTLGNPSAAAAPIETAANEPPVGAPGGRAAGAPLDLSTLAGNASPPSSAGPPPVATASAAPMALPQAAAPSPPPPVRNAVPTAPASPPLATLPPSSSPQDEYDMAYGYVLHKDYSLAEQAFRDFLRKHPNERLVPDAQYWLGESLFQQQRYRDAAESFLAVSTKFERAGKAPDSLLRLGQSLVALNQKEAACATLAEVGRKYPHASASVKRGVAQEQKRAHC